MTGKKENEFDEFSKFDVFPHLRTPETIDFHKYVEDFWKLGLLAKNQTGKQKKWRRSCLDFNIFNEIVTKSSFGNHHGKKSKKVAKLAIFIYLETPKIVFFASIRKFCERLH